MYKEMEISVIVASHRPNFVGGLAAVLSTFVHNTISTEIIIVCDYNPESFRRIYPLIRWEFLGDKSISAKRNRGIALSNGKILAFIDDDCRPSRQWVKQGYDYLTSHPDQVGVEGQTTIACPSTQDLLITDYKRLETPAYRTNNIFYRTEAVKKIGGFDERFSVQREDVDLAFSLLKEGYTIGFSPDIRISHMIRRNDSWDLLKNCWNRRFDPLLFKKHSQMYRNHLGSPWSGSILTSGFIFTAVLCLIGRNKDLKWLAGMPLISSTIFAFRRRKGMMFKPMQLAVDIFSAFLAPWVLLSALLFGSIKHRKIFLF